MGLFSMFKSCRICKRSGLVTAINPDGLCPDCALSMYQRPFHVAKSLLDGCPIVYKYRMVAVQNVNREILRQMVDAEQFCVNLSVSECVSLNWNGQCVAVLNSHVSMCKDWLARKDPIVCEFVSFKAGEEKVELCFYQDAEKHLKDRECNIVQLTSFRSSEKQETIDCLECGELLTIAENDIGKLIVQDIDYGCIGNLPAKFVKLFNEGKVSKVFFDHSETEEKDSGDEILIPFVRIYS